MFVVCFIQVSVFVNIKTFSHIWVLPGASKIGTFSNFFGIYLPVAIRFRGKFDKSISER
jgi:hypothetical protein